MVSVIVPALNEEGAIVETVERAFQALHQANCAECEVIVINDGSSDRTPFLARDAGAKVINHIYSMGYGRSLKDGILNAKHDTIIIVDADGTYPLEEIPKLLSLFSQGFDLIVGKRQGTNYEESRTKRWLREILRFMVEFTTGQKIPDINSGLRVFSKQQIIPYFDQLCNTFSFTTSQTLAYLMTGKFVGYTPIAYHKRIGQKKVRLFKDSLRTLQYIVQAALYYNPLKVFLLLTIALGCMALPFIVCGLILNSSLLIILGSLQILTGALLFALGLLSDLLRQVLIKVQYREIDGSVVRGNVVVFESRRQGVRVNKKGEVEGASAEARNRVG